MKVELCVDSVESVELASKYNLNRVELCSALSIGGLCPSVELTEHCKAIADKVEIHVMIRHREGFFVYSDNEFEMMLESIQHFGELGVQGVVFGCLTEAGEVNKTQTMALVEKANQHHLQSTFHRAFDFCVDPFISLGDLIDLKVNRILTSGKFEYFPNQIENFKNLVQLAKGKIEIMAGSGLNANNIATIAATGVDAVHFTSHSLVGDASQGMGQQSIPNEFKLKELLNQINSYSSSN